MESINNIDFTYEKDCSIINLSCEKTDKIDNTINKRIRRMQKNG